MKSAGFTLIEVIAAIALMAVVLSIALPVMVDFSKRSSNAQEAMSVVFLANRLIESESFREDKPSQTMAGVDEGLRWRWKKIQSMSADATARPYLEKLELEIHTPRGKRWSFPLWRVQGAQ